MINTSVSRKILKRSLLGGAIYFFLVSAAHMFNIKVPVLFIYFNMPSYAYQDKIISFLAFGWAMFLYSGFAGVKKNALWLTKYILLAGSGAIIGLCIINTETNFNELAGGVKPFIFWIEALFLFGYLVWLTILCSKLKE